MQLFDQFNRPIPALKRPETREIASVSIRDRWSSYPSRGLTPGRLASIFYAADAGDLRSQAELFTEMKQKDTHLYSVLGTRRLAALGLDWQVEDVSEDPQDKKIAEFCREQLKTLKLKALMKHLLGAVGHGYAAAEILWQTASPQWGIRGFNFIHAKNITFLNSPAPLVITDDNSQGVEPKPFQLAFHLYGAESGYDTPTGVLRVCAWMFLFKNYSVKDWVVFCEIFGMPLRLGKYEASASPADREALRLAISALGTDAAGIISKSTEIEFVEASSRLSGTTNPYEVLANFCNREMSKAVLGQTLTTDSAPGSGTLAGNAHAQVRQDLLEADAEALAETIREQILLPLVGFNFGWDAAMKGLPEFVLQLQEEQDLEVDSKVIKNLKDAGAGSCIPKSHINKHFGIPEPKAGEETLGDEPATTSINNPTQPQQPLGPSGPDDKTPGGRPAGKAGEKGKGKKGEKEKAAAMKAELPLQDPPLSFADNGLGELGSYPQDRQMIAALMELETLTRVSLASLPHGATEGIWNPILELLRRAKSLEEFRGGLVEIFKDLDVSGFADHLHQSLVLANLRARLPGAENA